MVMPMLYGTDKRRESAPARIIPLLATLLLALGALALTGCDLDRDHGGGPDYGGSSGGGGGSGSHSGGCH